MTKYYFNDDSWTYSVCDCCPPTEMECYNIDLDIHPDFEQNGSALSIEDCWRDVLIHEGIISEADDMNSRKLFALLGEYDIDVHIEGTEDE